MSEKNMLQYIECGLDNVWLANGFEFVETDYGDGVMVHNPSGLHRAIALHLCEQNESLTGEQFRFLRKEMNLSQEVLAKLLEVKALTIANYEKGRGKKGVPKSVDVVMRSLYLEYIKKDSPVTRMLKQIVELDSQSPTTSFKFNKGRWYPGQTPSNPITE